MDKILGYLKNIMEGTPNLPPWSRWFEENREDLEKLLSRGSFLRLKTYPLQEIPKILEHYQMTYHPVACPLLPTGEEDFFWIRREWIGEIVEPYAVPNYQKVRPGEYLYADLLQLAKIKQEHDEVRYFSTPDGALGICLVRGGKPVFAIFLLLT